MPSRAAVAALARVRKFCLALPDVTEKPSHGAPTWFVKVKGQGTKTFLNFVDNHHGDDRLALWCFAAPGAQAMLVESDPDVYFVPAYVGPSGWVGVRLDKRLPWAQVEAVIEQAYQARVGGVMTAPRPRVARPRGRTGASARRR